ncbi:hypothetical protein OURE66S_03274 [Oligella ureolytica]
MSKRSAILFIEIAKADLALTLPGEHNGTLQHEKTVVTAAGWLTEGKFNDLILDNRLLQLLGLEENLTTTLAALQAEDLASLPADERHPLQAFITGEFADNSRWNSQPLQGGLDLGLFFQDIQHNFRVNKADIDLRLGQSHINSEGAFGESGDSLVLSVKAPRLNQLWPDLPGSVDYICADGTIVDNVLVTKGRFSQGDFKELGKAPIDFELRTAGGWQVLTEEGYEGWGWYN